MSDINIRIASIEDINVIYSIDSVYQFDKYSRNLIESSISDDINFNIVAEIGGVVVGSMSSTIIIDECNVLKIVVLPGYRNIGVASRLMQYTIQYAKDHEVKMIFLEVRKSRSNTYISITRQNNNL